MKKKNCIAAAALSLVLAAGALAGCASSEDFEYDNWDGREGLTEGASPVMPPSHEGRFESMGAIGCYGCHGNNEDGDNLLYGAPDLPDDHYLDSDPRNAWEIDGTHSQCTTCHVVGVAEDEEED